MDHPPGLEEKLLDFYY